MLALAVWTGEELIVVGGYDDDPCLPTRESDAAGGGSGFPSAVFCFAIKSLARNGAAFDPDTGTWRPIATPPVPVTRSLASAVVHDGVVYILVAGQPGAFLAYHPGQDRWEELPPPTTRLGILIEAGDRLALFRNDNSEGNPDDWWNDPNREVAPDLLFDPETMAWSEIPPDPLIPSFDRAMVWTGSELVLLGAEAVPQPGSDAPAFMRAAIFNPETGAWRRLPDSDLVIAGGYRWYLADGRLINPTLDAADGGETNPYDRSYPRGGILELESGEWLALPDPPVDPYVPGAFIGYSAGSPDELLSGYGWLFDPATGRWQSLPAPPDNSSIPVPRNGSTVLFAGPDLVVWGGFLYGEDGRGEMVATGWMWRPGT